MGDTPTVFDLSPPEKLQLVQDLWDDLSSDPDSVPVRDWHKEELDSRNENLEETPEASLSDLVQQMGKIIVTRQMRYGFDCLLDDRRIIPFARETIEGILEYLKEERIDEERVSDVEENLKDHALDLFLEASLAYEDEPGKEFESRTRKYFLDIYENQEPYV